MQKCLEGWFHVTRHGFKPQWLRTLLRLEPSYLTLEVWTQVTWRCTRTEVTILMNLDSIWWDRKSHLFRLAGLNSIFKLRHVWESYSFSFSLKSTIIVSVSCFIVAVAHYNNLFIPASNPLDFNTMALFMPFLWGHSLQGTYNAAYELKHSEKEVLMLSKEINTYNSLYHKLYLVNRLL